MIRPFRILTSAALGCAAFVALPAQADSVAWGVSIGGPGYAISAGSPRAGPGFAPSPWIGPRFAPGPVVFAPSPWVGPRFAPPPWAGPRFAPAPVFYGPPSVRRGPPHRVIVVQPAPRHVHVHPQRGYAPDPVYFGNGPRW
jgi:hypothetical protein